MSYDFQSLRDFSDATFTRKHTLWETLLGTVVHVFACSGGFNNISKTSNRVSALDVQSKTGKETRPLYNSPTFLKSQKREIHKSNDNEVCYIIGIIHKTQCKIFSVLILNNY